MSQAGQQSGRKNLIDYCERFSSLNVSSTKKRGNAPYKPVLLLSVIDLITQGSIQENKIFVSDDLINTFNKYWKILASGYQGGLHYPFFHLQNEGFWYLVFKSEFNGLQPKTVNKLKAAVEYATLDNDLFELLLESATRKELVDALIAAWFTSTQSEFEEVLSINDNLQDIETGSLETDKGLENNLDKKFYLRKSVIRNAFFRKSIVYIYNYQCALCGLKVIHSLTQSIVDGAHIKPFAKFYDSRVDNGLSLCKNHHWAFDQGLFTIDDNYKIIVSKDFEEQSPNAKLIKDFQSQTLLLPNSQKYFPRLESLKWHRENIFRDSPH